MNTNSVRVVFDNLVSDYIAADRLYYRSTIWAKVDKIVAVLLVLAGFVLLYGAGVQWWTLIPFPLAFLEWFNLLSPRPLILRYWFKRNPKLQERYDLSFDDDGIHFLTKSIDARIKWDQYTAILEDEQLWLLIYGHRLYSVIPKHAFTDSGQVARFVALITQHIISCNVKA